MLINTDNIFGNLFSPNMHEHTCIGDKTLANSFSDKSLRNNAQYRILDRMFARIYELAKYRCCICGIKQDCLLCTQNLHSRLEIRECAEDFVSTCSHLVWEVTDNDRVVLQS